MSIDIPARAQADIDFYAEELGERSQRVALAFLHRLDEALQLLESQPRLSGEVEPPYPRFPGMRVFQLQQFPQHLVYYTPTVTGIRVVRVIHASRDAGAIFG